MRQAQNAKRARGRSRKVVNQLSRTMDSSGPDVKIRGTASHIYEKYQTLARDANASGDRIMAENYLQHAEHYLRLINALQNTPARDGQPAVNGARNNDAAEDAAGGEQPAAAQQPAQEAPVQATPSRGRGRRRANGGTPQQAPAPAAAPPSSGAASPELSLVDSDAPEPESVRA